MMGLAQSIDRLSVVDDEKGGTNRLNRDRFLRSMVQKMAGALEDVVGIDDAFAFISLVGRDLGIELDEEYKARLGVRTLTREEIAEILVDLKRSIEGDFYVVSQDDAQIELGNRVCPFGEQVLGHPSICMMTSTMFGSIAARNTGYAKVELRQTIAEGASGCAIVVHLRRTEAARQAAGREYVDRSAGLGD
jgi:predicted ArsR family transcriptional regulator